MNYQVQHIHNKNKLNLKVFKGEDMRVDRKINFVDL